MDCWIKPDETTIQHQLMSSIWMTVKDPPSDAIRKENVVSNRR